MVVHKIIKGKGCRPRAPWLHCYSLLERYLSGYFVCGIASSVEIRIYVIRVILMRDWLLVGVKNN